MTNKGVLNRDVILNVYTDYYDGVFDSVRITTTLGSSYSRGTEIERRYRELVNHKTPTEVLLYTEETVKGKYSSEDVAKKHLICKGLMKHIGLVENSGCRIAAIECNEEILFTPNELDSEVRRFLEYSDTLLERDNTSFSSFNL